MAHLDLFYDNIVFALQKVGGISVYWYELTKRLLEDENVNMHFFETGSENTNIYRQKLNLNSHDVSLNKRGGLSIERFMRVPIKQNFQKGVFHSSYFRLPQKTNRLKTVCSVYDFIHDKYHKSARVYLHNLSKRRAIEESDTIITISESTKADLLEYYPKVKPEKVHTIYLASSPVFRQIDIDPNHINYPFLLYIGVRFSYKNFLYTVELASKLKDFNLYIVGSPLTKNENVFVQSKLGDRFKIFTGIDAEQLNELYNKAFCLIYPSSYEGFGMPPLEAMQAGCPFIAMNTSSLPEVAGNAGILLNSLEIEEGINAIESIKSNYQLIKRNGFEQAKKFSWDNCYQQTLQLYKSLL